MQADLAQPSEIVQVWRRPGDLTIYFIDIYRADGRSTWWC
jgi:hypothetical protein